MKKLLLYISVIIFLASCSESEYNGSRVASLNRRYLSVSTNAITFDASPSTKRLSVEADETDWNVNVPAKWLTVTPYSGKSSASVDIFAQLNNSGDTSRVCVATVSSTVEDWKRSFPITITQLKNTPYIIPSESSIDCSALQQSLSFSVSTNVEYIIENTGSSWLHVASSSECLVEVTVDENNTDDERYAVLTLKAKSNPGVSTAVNIRQKKANITASMEVVKFGHKGSSQTIEIESEASWEASATSWVSVTPKSGESGRLTVTITVPRNASVNKRTGSAYFTISGSHNVEVPIEQEGVNLTLSTQALSFDSFGETLSVDIISNDEWSISSMPDWVTIDQTSGEGNATIKLTTQDNNTTTEKKGELVINTKDDVATKSIQLNQKAKNVEYADATLSFRYAQSSQNVSFITDGSWSLTSDADWFSVDKNFGSGNATLTITVEENNTVEERNGTVHLTIVDQNYTISIHQDCKYVALPSSAFTFDASPNKTVLSFGSNTQWKVNVAEGGSWLDVTPLNGNGDAEITITTAENNTASVRKGKISIEIPNVQTYVVDVTQNRKYIKTDMASVDFISAGGQLSFNVISDGTYEVSKIGTWFGFIREGDVITVVAQKNSADRERKGAIILSLTNLDSGEYSVLVPVIQKP